MRSPLVPLILGAALLAGAVAGQRQQVALQREDVSGIEALRSRLDSVQRAAALAVGGPDSVRLAKEVAERKYYLARREFHVAPRQERIDAWWSVSGPGTLLAVGAVLLWGIAWWTWHRGRSRS